MLNRPFNKPTVKELEEPKPVLAGTSETTFISRVYFYIKIFKIFLINLWFKLFKSFSNLEYDNLYL